MNNIGSAKPRWRMAIAVFTACFAATVSTPTLAVIAIAPAPTLDNTAYVVMDFESGRILPPASLTKMMTSYIVEQALKAGRLKPTDMVSVSENAWCRGTNAESCMYLPVHGSASVIDILRGIIVQSGNDASKAIAEHMAGSEASFAVMMNKEAQRLGMKNTYFANATGLPDPKHRASAHDLALLARAIIRDSSDYYKIYSEKEFKYNGIKQGNRNALLYTDSSVDGLKTGHTAEAGFCLTASSKRNDMRLISVIMGAKSMQARADQTRALFNWGFGSFEDVRPVAANVSLATPKVRFGKADVVNVGLLAPMVATIPRGQAANVKADIQLTPGITAPIAKGAVLGKVVIMLDGQSHGEQALVALEPVDQAGFFKRLWQRLAEFFSSN